jgi:hypothetical protein
VLTSGRKSAVRFVNGAFETMAKAYRTDALGNKKFREEIQRSKHALEPQRVQCPQAGCECTYEMYGCETASLAEYVAKLQDRVGREHPSHTSEVLAINEFRKALREKKR